MKIKLLLILLLLCFISIQAQEIIEPDTSDLITYLNNNKSKDKKWQRKSWYLLQRLGANGKIPNIDSIKYQEFSSLKRRNQIQNRATHGQWQFIGHDDVASMVNYQGRVNSIDFHPTNSNIIYLCTSNGGIWKTTDHGNTWTNLTDHLPLTSFADLELDPTNPDRIYALTGDGDPAPGPNSFHAQGEVSSVGIIISEDGGVSWSPIRNPFSSALLPTQLLVHPTNANVQFIAEKNGLYKTTDGWLTADRVFPGLIYDIEFNPGNPSTMYASSDNFIYRSVNDGNNGTWLPINDSDFDSLAVATRIELAVTPASNGKVAAIAGNWRRGSTAIYISNNNGANNTWDTVDSTTNIIGAFATYCIGLAMDPQNSNSLIGGGVGLFQSNNNGNNGSWTQQGTGVVHADIHDIKFNNGNIYVASDGGLSFSDDNGATWQDLSKGLLITEIYRIGGSITRPDYFMYGTQDNGTFRGKDGIIQRKIGNDGMTCMIDDNFENTAYGMTQNGGFRRSLDGGETFEGIPTPFGEGAWISPLAFSKIVSNCIYMGKDTLIQSCSRGEAGTWTDRGSIGGLINNIETTAQNTQIAYITSGANIFRTNNIVASFPNRANWTNVSAGLPGSFITGIVSDPTNSNHVYAVMGNYVDGNKVYESTNGGLSSSWSNISGSLPNIPVLSIAYHEDASGKDRLYIGTDIGVFYRDNDIGDWIYFSNQLPVVPVTDLFINPDSGTITAGTYGRGLWRSSLKSNCFTNTAFSSSVTHKGELHYSYSNSISSAATLSSDPGTTIYYNAGNYIDFVPGFNAKLYSFMEAKIQPCQQ